MTPHNVAETLFSEHELVEAPSDEPETQPLVTETGTSLLGTSDPLLANPSLTDVLSNFPIWPQVDESISHNLQTTASADPQHAASSSTKDPGPASHGADQRKRKPGDAPQQVKVDQDKVFVRASLRLYT